MSDVDGELFGGIPRSGTAPCELEVDDSGEEPPSITGAGGGDSVDEAVASFAANWSTTSTPLQERKDVAGAAYLSFVAARVFDPRHGPIPILSGFQERSLGDFTPDAKVQFRSGPFSHRTTMDHPPPPGPQVYLPLWDNPEIPWGRFSLLPILGLPAFGWVLEDRCSEGNPRLHRSR